ncbi:MAG: eukaryotic translation initiation factor eIF-2 alpha, partial [Hyperionvirus sp.]
MSRYYEKTVPNVGDILVVKITKISDNKGAYAESAEYPDLKIFILPTEINRRVVNVKKFFSPDKLYPTRVLFVDPVKHLVDVSYSKLNDKEKLEYLERFTIYQKIFRIAVDINTLYNNDGDTIFKNTVWHIFDNLCHESNETVSNYYTSILEDPYIFFK